MIHRNPREAEQTDCNPAAHPPTALTLNNPLNIREIALRCFVFIIWRENKIEVALQSFGGRDGSLHLFSRGLYYVLVFTAYELSFDTQRAKQKRRVQRSL